MQILYLPDYRYLGQQIFQQSCCLIDRYNMILAGLSMDWSLLMDYFFHTIHVGDIFMVVSFFRRNKMLNYRLRLFSSLLLYAVIGLFFVVCG